MTAKREGSAGKGEANESVKAQMEVFAEACFNPQSLTFGNVVLSFRAAYKGEQLSEVAEHRKAYRWLNNAYVKKCRARMLMRANDGGPISKEAFIRQLMDNEEFYRKRGARGDAQAATAMMEMLGKSIDVFPRAGKKKDPQLPTDIPGLLKAGEAAANILAAAEKLKRLSAPNPVAGAEPAEIVGEIHTVPLESKVVVDAQKRKKMCVNHPDKTAHYLSWKSDRPRCQDCIEHNK